MATITLTGGDFGSDASVIAGEEAFYLPDVERPGLSERVPFTEIETLEAQGDDRTGQVKEAAKLSARGFAGLGPIGLAAGALAVRKVKDVAFAVRLKDGRGFTATGDAVTVARLGSFVRGMVPPDREAEDSASRADALIARYLRERGDAPPPAEAGTKADVVAPAGRAPDAPVTHTGAPTVSPDAEPSATRDANPSRPVFGRRRNP